MVATRSPQSASCGGVRTVAPAAMARAVVASTSSTQSWKIVLARPGDGAGAGQARVGFALRIGAADREGGAADGDVDAGDLAGLRADPMARRGRAERHQIERRGLLLPAPRHEQRQPDTVLRIEPVNGHGRISDWEESTLADRSEHFKNIAPWARNGL